MNPLVANCSRTYEQKCIFEFSIDFLQVKLFQRNSKKKLPGPPISPSPLLLLTSNPHKQYDITDIIVPPGNLEFLISTGI